MVQSEKLSSGKELRLEICIPAHFLCITCVCPNEPPCVQVLTIIDVSK